MKVRQRRAHKAVNTVVLRIRPVGGGGGGRVLPYIRYKGMVFDPFWYEIGYRFNQLGLKSGKV